MFYRATIFWICIYSEFVYYTEHRGDRCHLRMQGIGGINIINVDVLLTQIKKTWTHIKNSTAAFFFSSFDLSNHVLG